LEEQTFERITEALVHLGHDAASATRRGNKGLTAGWQLLVAAQLRRIVVSNDVDDFTMLHDAWSAWSQARQVTPLHADILLIRSSPRLGPDEVAAAIHQCLITHAPIDNRAFVWSLRQGWREIQRPVSRR